MGIGVLTAGFLFGIACACGVAMLGASWMMMVFIYSVAGSVGTLSAAVLALEGQMGLRDIT
ncbi:hypothetical protein [Rhodovulum sp. FJ3]|uniref:hypothetical protein n=1 Tax=Rhodovulum sp. FJ3 TaxID=3079053 RepID=UPI00293DEAA7|nr:hypothetical protein [Rhodovulum sp. FJ3]MDV4167304.1 hypothetical protein [Rhodovulum sp. FJ3]